MQTDDTEEPTSSPEDNSQTEKMTFTKGTTLITPENFPISPINETDSSCKIPNFDNINLEDDIEKVEVDSVESPSPSSSSSSASSSSLLNSVDQINKPEYISLQDFAGIPEEHPSESVKNWLQKITEVPTPAAAAAAAVIVNKKPSSSNNVQQIATTRVVKYQDLPYMGEITLDNSKPRRGRKPKKADICHLIYKNYGTIFPGTPNASSYLEKESTTSRKHAAAILATVANTNEEGSSSSRSDVQNKIISSLLEKRLTQENKKPSMNKHKTNQNEPLNLCIRDMNHLKIRLLNKNEKTVEIKSEPQSDDDIEIITETPSPMTVKSELRYPSATPDSISASSSDTPNTPDGPNGTGGYVYWPNAGVFIHPLALQQQLMMYQRLAGNMNCSLPSSHSPKPPPNITDTIKTEPTDVTLRKIVPKVHKSHDSASDVNHHEVKSKRNAHATANEKTPAKRKRSAIFIPPIPTENSTNPATEVSICKFKFTGGAKPSLQEKKMLSVDSGGNFRYYSGTGDKSMRGYEFFPRETLQQQISNTQGSSTGAFLQASGEKIYPIPPLDITGGNTTSDFLLTPQLPGSSLVASQHQDAGNINHHHVRNKKRKSRKSIQREKLEQTFKEKGFLIQTQQLESAEGATYCKFRQLRKFTRYLFRSWKDYLPGNVREMQENEQREQMQLANISEMPNDGSSSMDGLSIISGDIASTS